MDALVRGDERPRDRLRRETRRPAATHVKISFVVPAYNEENLLGACLQSVVDEIARGGVDAEVIVVDNASTDRTADVARAYPGVRVVREPRKGITRARQAGFLCATGDLVANVDADTIVPAGWTVRALRAFEKDPRLVAYSGPYRYYDLPFRYQVPIVGFYLVGYVIHLVGRLVLGSSTMAQGGNCVLSRAALQAVGGFDTAIESYGEDIDVARRLNGVGTVRWTPRFSIRTSGRRLRQEGLFRTGWVYALNFVSVTLRRTPATTAYVDVRTTRSRL